MAFPHFITLVIFLFPLAYSPGPGNMFFAALGAHSGMIASFPANIGYHLATFIVSFSIGLGFSVAVAPGGYMMAILQGFGAVYIFWLAFKTWHSGPGSQLSHGGQAGFLQGVLLLILNPKGYMIMALMFSQFPTELWGQTVMIAAVFTLNNMVAFLVWTLAGQTLTRLFQSPKAARRINAGFAGCLAVMALWLLTA